AVDLREELAVESLDRLAVGLVVGAEFGIALPERVVYWRACSGRRVEATVAVRHMRLRTEHADAPPVSTARPIVRADGDGDSIDPRYGACRSPRDGRFAAPPL